MKTIITTICLCLALGLCLAGCGSKAKEEVKTKEAQLEQKDAELKALKLKFQDSSGLLGQREGELRAVNEALAVVVKERDACQASAESGSASREDPRRLKDELEKLNKKYKDVVTERDRLKRRLEVRP